MNQNGQRFSNESRGYSEQAVDVIKQPGAIAWTFYDEPRHQLMLEFDDYRDAIAAGAIQYGSTLQDICRKTGLPLSEMEKTLGEITSLAGAGSQDAFGRRFKGKALLSAPYYAVKVTGALFHTQGGLCVDAVGRVLRADGSALQNLYAGGGAARGISGPDASGYLAGNGLLTATTFGRLAGINAAIDIKAS